MDRRMIFDLTALATEYDREIGEAERALRVAQIRLAAARSRKMGMLRTIEELNRQMQPTITHGEVPPVGDGR